MSEVVFGKSLKEKIKNAIIKRDGAFILKIHTVLMYGRHEKKYRESYEMINDVHPVHPSEFEVLLQEGEEQST